MAVTDFNSESSTFLNTRNAIGCFDASATDIFGDKTTYSTSSFEAARTVTEP